MPKNKLTAYDYINSNDGDDALMQSSLNNAAFQMDIFHAIQVAMRSTKELIQRHDDGEIKMTDTEYNELKDNYEEMSAMLNGNQ